MYELNLSDYVSQRYTDFRRGTLAGLSPQGREAARSASLYTRHHRLLSMASQRTMYDNDWDSWCFRNGYPSASSYFMTTVSADSTLEECLDGSTCDYLRSALRCTKAKLNGYCRKADMVRALVDVLPNSRETLSEMIAHVSDETLEAFSAAIDSRPRVIGVRSIDAASNAVCGHPYLFLNKRDQHATPYVPQELRELMASINLGDLMQERSEWNYIERILYNGVILCGVISLDDAYKCYLQQGADYSYTKQEFTSKAKQICKKTHCMRIFESGKALYVRLMPNQMSFKRGFTSYSSYARVDFSYRNAGISSGTLVSLHQNISTRAFSMSHKLTDAASYVYGLPSVAKLTSYFDEHIPYGEDDESFAEDEVDSVLGMMMFSHYSLSDVAKVLSIRGWCAAEGTNVALSLTQLIRDLYRELPRWELNGWSIVECEGLHDVPTVISDAAYDDKKHLLAS